MDRYEMENVKLNIFVNAFWNSGKGMSGGDKRILEILRNWQNENERLPFEVFIYAPQKFLEILKEEKINSFEMIVTSTSNSENKNVIISYLIHTLRVLCKIPYFQKKQIFYSSSDFFPDTIPCLIGRIMNKKSIWISSTYHIIEHYKTRPGNRINNFISYHSQKTSLWMLKRFSHRVLVDNPLLKEALIKKNFNISKITIINNGVDVNAITQITPSETQKYDCIMLARLAFSKGIYDIPEVWKQVVKKKPNVALALIGSGTEEVKADLKKRLAECSVENNVHLLGFLSTQEAYSLLKSAKIFIFTSREEGWGISIAEAMTCGLPVVAFELPVYQYIFPCGMISVKDRDCKEMAQQIVYLLENESRREELGKKAKEYVDAHYDWKTIALEERNIIERESSMTRDK